VTWLDAYSKAAHCAACSYPLQKLLDQSYRAQTTIYEEINRGLRTPYYYRSLQTSNSSCDLSSVSIPNRYLQ
jgi:hypothetical protein